MAEPPAVVEQELVPLPVRLLELGVVVDIREELAVREEQNEVAIEVGIGEGRAQPTRADVGAGSAAP